MEKVKLEQIEKFKSCKTTEEIVAIAKLENIDITVKQAEEILKKLVPLQGQISDQELEKVAGGRRPNKFTDVI